MAEPGPEHAPQVEPQEEPPERPQEEREEPPDENLLFDREEFENMVREYRCQRHCRLCLEVCDRIDFGNHMPNYTYFVPW